MTADRVTTTSIRAAMTDRIDAPFRVASLALPEPGRGQVRVRIRASGVNPLDAKIRAGQAPHARQPLPAVLGLDLAGTVEAVGPEVVSLRAGDEVYGLAGGVGGLQGTLADCAVVDADLLAIKPARLSFRDTAALPLVFITAWEGLVDRAQVQAGQRVLVQGGAGGVGHIAVQIARARGAEVFATGSAKDLPFIERLGAVAIDYRATSVEASVADHTAGEGFDIVYDTGGGATLDASFNAVRRFGHVVSCLGWGTHALAPLSFRAATYSGVFALLPMLTGIGRAHHGDILREASALVDAGKVTPRVDPRRFTLETADAAHQALATGAGHGKVVVETEPIDF